MVAIYVAALLFGGLLIAASLAGLGGHDGHGDGTHDDGGGHAWLSLFGLRFWSFGAAFFGLTGLVLHLAAGVGRRPWVVTVAAGAGVAAGLGASALFRALTGQSVGQLAHAGALVGREGRLLLPVERAQRGKVRLALPAGGHLDLIAESSEDEALAAGAEVLIVEVRGTVAVVARAPAAPPRRAD